jgi:hypothetical protein
MFTNLLARGLTLWAGLALRTWFHANSDGYM